VLLLGSIEELAGRGNRPGVLRATVDEYNAHCAKGYDATFAKYAKYFIVCGPM
jgi:hypothetical protein